MLSFNDYIIDLDFTPLINYVKEKGVLTKYKKGEYFLRQSELSKYGGYIASGIFRYLKYDTKGTLNNVGYGFKGDFVCDYATLITGEEAWIDAQAATNCEAYLFTRKDLLDFWEMSMDNQRFGRNVAEEVFRTMYKRLLSFYCDTPEERYIGLLQRCPNLLQYISLREIASFIGVTPETVSHIRKRLLYK